MSTNTLSSRLLTSQVSLYKDEADALAIDAFVPSLIPGPLQTPEYARAVLKECGVTDPAKAEEAVKMRSLRGELLKSKTQREWRYVITPDALTPRPGMPSQVMHEQIQTLHSHLRNLPQLQIRILSPFRVIWYSGFAILTTPRGIIVNLETASGRLILPEETTAVQRSHFADLFAAADAFPT